MAQTVSLADKARLVMSRMGMGRVMGVKKTTSNRKGNHKQPSGSLEPSVHCWASDVGV